MSSARLQAIRSTYKNTIYFSVLAMYMWKLKLKIEHHLQLLKKIKYLSVNLKKTPRFVCGKL